MISVLLFCTLNSWWMCISLFNQINAIILERGEGNLLFAYLLVQKMLFKPIMLFKQN